MVERDGFGTGRESGIREKIMTTRQTDGHDFFIFYLFFDNTVEKLHNIS